jgi:hypothetical protein
MTRQALNVAGTLAWTAQYIKSCTQLCSMRSRVAPSADRHALKYTSAYASMARVGRPGRLLCEAVINDRAGHEVRTGKDRENTQIA